MKDQHPTAAEIAALGEDLLEEAEGARVHAHVEQCTTCSGTVADLRILRSELASLYPDQPMPEDLAARIDDALAEESPSVSRETRDVPRRRMYLLAAAGAVVALSVGAIVVQTAGSSGDEKPVADAAAGAASDETRDEEHGEEAAGAAADEPTEDAAESRLEADVRELLAESDDADALNADELHPLDDTSTSEADVLSDEDGEQQEEADPDHSPAEGTESLPSCVSSVINRSESPLAATDDYRHEGTSSYLVVLPHSGDPSVIDAYVVDAACADSSPPSDEDVLEKRSYPLDSR